MAVVQMTSTNSTAENESSILAALGLIEKPVDLVCFPENCWMMRLRDGDILPDFHQAARFQDQLKAEAKRLGAAIVLGTVPIEEPGDQRPYAATWVVAPTGEMQVLYRKLHLFDVDVAGVKPVRESDSLRPGFEPTVWVYKGFRIGCAICYDVRFSNLFFEYARHECDLMMLPSAFLVPTGRNHWETLVRARAIESQCYFVAAAQSGEHVESEAADGATSSRGALGPVVGPGVGAEAVLPARKEPAVRRTYGRSLIVDPWGRVVASAAAEKSGLEVMQWSLEMSEIARVRSQIPMARHRRVWDQVRTLVLGVAAGAVVCVFGLMGGASRALGKPNDAIAQRANGRTASQPMHNEATQRLQERARIGAQLGDREDELKVRSELISAPRTPEPLPGDLRALEAGSELSESSGASSSSD